MDKQENTLWIFGYASLIWKPDFEYASKHVGHIRGFMRRFWQGNTTHRGSKEKPGRVATLIEDESSIVWGVAYEVVGEESIKKISSYLFNREISLGGYRAFKTTFFHTDKALKSNPDVLVFIATEQNDLFLGPADTMTMARQVIDAKGDVGPNAEYIIKLADFVRTHIPQDNDKHMFELDAAIRYLLRKRKKTFNLAENVTNYITVAGN